jgi:hypothetical protein
MGEIAVQGQLMGLLNMTCGLLPYIYCILNSFLCLCNILASFQTMWWFSLNTCCADLDISRHLCSFCRCSDVLPGKLQCDHPPCTPYPAPVDIYLSLKVKNCSCRMISGCWRCQAAYNCWIKCSLFGYLQRKFCANFWTVWQVCCNWENMLKEIATIFSVYMFMYMKFWNFMFFVPCVLMHFVG